MTKQKYIILDRDGVINIDSSTFVKDQNEFIPIPRSLDAIRILSDNNFNIIVISNQSGIDRGLISPSNFIHINIKMINLIEKSGGTIQAVLYCPEGPMSNDINRKPNPGMFLDIAERLNITLASCFSIGDSPRDIEASISAKCKPIGVRTGNGKKIENNNKFKVPIFDDLYDAVSYVISK